MVRVGTRATFALGRGEGQAHRFKTYAGEPFFSAHFASTSLCFFFGSFKCSSQRKRKRGPFERFPHPGKRQLMSRLLPRRVFPDPSWPLRTRVGAGRAAVIRSTKIWANRSTRASKGCEGNLGIMEICSMRLSAQLKRVCAAPATSSTHLSLAPNSVPLPLVFGKTNPVETIFSNACERGRAQAAGHRPDTAIL